MKEYIVPVIQLHTICINEFTNSDDGDFSGNITSSIESGTILGDY